MDHQIRTTRGKPARPRIVQRWDIPVFLWAESLQPGFAGMQVEHPDTSRAKRINKQVKTGLLIHIVNANTAFDRNRKISFGLHRGNTFSNQIGLGHQAGTKTTGLHTV